MTGRRIEIQPQPTDAERRAIEIALAAEPPPPPQPAAWLDDDPADDGAA